LQRGYILFDYAAKARFSFFGVSAKYVDALRGTGLRLVDKKEQYDLRHLRMVGSTGSPLTHEAFDYVYKDLLPNVHLASLSGGTDIISCFVLGNPLSAVRRGEIQGAGLGMDVDVFDENGKPVRSGKGELVCKTPFPSMPTGFWNDDDGAKFSKAYFDRFSGVWHHGDWCEWTLSGGMIIHGRSDATLNPGGVRIGTAEIYRVVEQLPEIKECIAVGQDWDNDVRVILFVTMKDGFTMDDVLSARIKKSLRDQASPRHVPAKIITVADIPRTKNGKLTELAVRDVIHGRAIKNVEALLNPAALDLYKDLPELKS
jgi:acetoacetyl-CoA synthetase